MQPVAHIPPALEEYRREAEIKTGPRWHRHKAAILDYACEKDCVSMEKQFRLWQSRDQVELFPHVALERSKALLKLVKNNALIAWGTRPTVTRDVYRDVTIVELIRHGRFGDQFRINEKPKRERFFKGAGTSYRGLDIWKPSFVPHYRASATVTGPSVDELPTPEDAYHPAHVLGLLEYEASLGMVLSGAYPGIDSSRWQIGSSHSDPTTPTEDIDIGVLKAVFDLVTYDSAVIVDLQPDKPWDKSNLEEFRKYAVAAVVRQSGLWSMTYRCCAVHNPARVIHLGIHNIIGVGHSDFPNAHAEYIVPWIR